MKASLMDALNTRFADIEDNHLCNVATLLDTQFKSRFLKEATASEAKAGVILAAASHVAAVELKTTVKVVGCSATK